MANKGKHLKVIVGYVTVPSVMGIDTPIAESEAKVQ
jgi:hypothetical protein